MRKVALVFILSVLIPSSILAWLAIRSLRDQEFVLERQQALLYQATSDALAERIRTYMNELQKQFGDQVEKILSDENPRSVAPDFHERILHVSPFAQVGFAVTSDGILLCPPLFGNPEAKRFRHENEPFLSNREVVEVYNQLNVAQTSMLDYQQGSSRSDSSSLQGVFDSLKSSSTKKEAKTKLGDKEMEAASKTNAESYERHRETVGTRAAAASGRLNQAESEKIVAAPQPIQDEVQPPSERNQAMLEDRKSSVAAMEGQSIPTRNLDQPQSSAIKGNVAQATASKDVLILDSSPQESDLSIQSRQKRDAPLTKNVQRTVLPEKQFQTEVASISKVVPEEAEFRKLILNANSGSLARFVGTRLNLLMWYRSPLDPQLIFGTELNLPRVTRELSNFLYLDPPLDKEICVTLLDHTGKPIARSDPQFETNWKRPFVATELGEILPHWEIAVYLLHPEKLNQTARTLHLTFALIIGVLVCAIAMGGWLIVTDLQRHLLLARQKTDFVSNVSHELKTPLTSIRMFSELLVDNRVKDPEKRHSYLQIISAEAARLTRLINNVLDFSRIERGEKKYDFEDFDITKLITETVENYRPHLEAAGFKLHYQESKAHPIVRGDRDAIAQVLVNLISNAEKYGAPAKEVTVETRLQPGIRSFIEILVMDRGPGVPRTSEERIFEQFYRAHDSLNSGIQGSGLGLTLARQIARAHHGDVTYQTREGGGSCFILKLPAPGATS